MLLIKHALPTVTPAVAEPRPCMALAPLYHFVEAVPLYDGRVAFCAPGVFVPSPTVDAARWLAQFLEV